MFFTYSTRFLLSTFAANVLSLLLTSIPAQAAAPDPATKCEVAKLKAAGTKATCLATEETKTILGKPSNPAKCENAFTKAFANAESAAAKAGGSCTVTGDVAIIEGLVDACVDDIAAALDGSPPAPCPQFPATGQTTVYQADKNDGIAGTVAVPDDGTFQTGALLSYTDNGDGTITDNNTGLMWEKKSHDGGLHEVRTAYYWSNGLQETIWDWLEDVNTEGGTGFAGYNDWRIPNVKELQSIVDYSRRGPALDPVFGPAAGSGYWSSTSSAFTSEAWNVNFSDGIVYRDNKGTDRFVRAVRGSL